MVLSLLLLLSVGAVLGSAALTRAVYRQQLTLDHSQQRLHRVACGLDERRRYQRLRANLLGAHEIAEVTVDGAARVVQTIHQGIASIPFGILEAIPATRAGARAVRVTHDAIAGTVYGAITGVNKGLGDISRSLLSGKRPAPPAKSKPDE